MDRHNPINFNIAKAWASTISAKHLPLHHGTACPGAGCPVAKKFILKYLEPEIDEVSEAEAAIETLLA